MVRKGYALASILALVASALPLAAAGIEVPDLETRIRNSGGDVPATAIPDVPNPEAVPLPANSAEAEAAPVAPAIPPSPEPELPVAPAEPAAEVPAEGTVSGWATLGAGSPGTLMGAVSVDRAGGTLPNFSLRFSYDAADGFGGESTGSGFFDRQISLGFGASSSHSGAWDASIRLSERTDGLQGMNVELYSLTSRDALWGASARLPVTADGALTLGLGLGGAVFASFADRPGTALSSASAVPVTGDPIVDTGGYRIEPGVDLAYTRGRGTFGIQGTYGYETVVNTGELNTGAVSLSAGGDFGKFSLDGRAGVSMDSRSGYAFPFNLSAAWRDEGGLLRLLSASGGMDAYRSGVDTLASTDPFVNRNRLSRTAADWFGRLEAGLSGPGLLGADTGLSGKAEWRDTALGFGILDALPLDEPSAGESAGLVPVAERERQSLSTELGFSASSAALRLGASWNAEWLDTEAPNPAHELSAELSDFDAGAVRRWELLLSLGIPLDGTEVPDLILSGTLRPARSFALVLSFDDIVPLATGKPRMRDAVYADRSGVLTLSGRIDF